ncbi:MAG: hypothetical protein LBN09_05305 [Clostridioides sp.]|nr:hypothetical protein [Clostridioides sp.]
MRWILVFIFLYLIPLTVLFTNYNSSKSRRFLLGGMYITVMTFVVTLNIYMSGLKRIEEAMNTREVIQVEVKKELTKRMQTEAKNQSTGDDFDSNDEIHDEINDDSNSLGKSSEDVEVSLELRKADNEESDTELDSDKNRNQDSIDKIIEPNKAKMKSETDKVDAFKAQVLKNEKIAFDPMMKCLKYTDNITKSIGNIEQVRSDVTDARDKCKELVAVYHSMKVPDMSNPKCETEMKNAVKEMEKAYIIRGESMNAALELVNTKNPKYISKVKDPLDEAKKNVVNFHDKIRNAKKIIEQDS